MGSEYPMPVKYAVAEICLNSWHGQDHQGNDIWGWKHFVSVEECPPFLAQPWQRGSEFVRILGVHDTREAARIQQTEEEHDLMLPKSWLDE